MSPQVLYNYSTANKTLRLLIGNIMLVGRWHHHLGRRRNHNGRSSSSRNPSVEEMDREFLNNTSGWSCIRNGDINIVEFTCVLAMGVCANACSRFHNVFTLLRTFAANASDATFASNTYVTDFSETVNTPRVLLIESSLHHEPVTGNGE